MERVAYPAPLKHRPLRYPPQPFAHVPAQEQLDGPLLHEGPVGPRRESFEAFKERVRHAAG